MSAHTPSRMSLVFSELFCMALLVLFLNFWSSALGDEIHDAATSGNLPRVRELIRASPSLVSAKDVYQNTPLICAVEYGHRDVAEWLLVNGADIEATDYNGETALGWAAGRGYKDVVELLLRHGAKVDVRRKGELTPLISASNKEVAELLVEHGADVNAMDEDGDTPIIKAEYSNGNDRRAWVNFLLAHGAKVGLISTPGLWIRIHGLWLLGIASIAIACWLYWFWNRQTAPAPQRLVRLAWWLGIYLCGSWTVTILGMWTMGFAHDPLLFVLEPLHMPLYLRFLLPYSWTYALFEHLPASVVTSFLDLAPFGVYLLLLVLSMYVKRLQSFCFLSVLLLVLIFLSGFGLAEGMASFPVPG